MILVYPTHRLPSNFNQPQFFDLIFIRFYFKGHSTKEDFLNVRIKKVGITTKTYFLTKFLCFRLIEDGVFLVLYKLKLAKTSYSEVFMWNTFCNPDTGFFLDRIFVDRSKFWRDVHVRHSGVSEKLCSPTG